MCDLFDSLGPDAPTLLDGWTTKDLSWLVTRLRSGPPPGFFRVPWVRSFPSLNEFFVHHEDVRRANGRSHRRAQRRARRTARP